MLIQNKNDCSYEDDKLKGMVSIKLFAWNAITTMGIQDKNTKNSIKRELKKLDINWLVYCYKAKCTVQWVEEHIRKDVCRLNSKLASTSLLVPHTEHHLSSFKCGFLNIFCAKTCCVVCHAYCFCYGGTNMAWKNVRKTTFHSTSEIIQL